MQIVQPNVTRRIITFIFILIISGQAHSQTQTNRLNVGINSNLNAYVEYLPLDYNPAEKYPLLINFMGLNAQGPGTTEADIRTNLYQEGFIPRFVETGAFPTSFQVGGTGPAMKFIIIT